MAKIIKMPKRFTAIEFFSGIGLARAGMRVLGIDVLWANDLDKKKCELYEAQWGKGHLCCMDVFDVDPDEVPSADIAWASSPCTDLSLAGKRDGLVKGNESRAFFGFLKVLEGMGNRKPKAVVLENVCGLASSHGGSDFRIVLESFNRLGYSVDAFELNAQRWLPQSRPRMFVVGVFDPIDGGELDTAIRPDKLSWIHSDPSIKTHVTPTKSVPNMLISGFTEIADDLPANDPRWWSNERLQKLIESLSPIQSVRFEKLVNSEAVEARTAYRRTRQGHPVWEIREDDIAGCLRTARGGSSKQAVVFMGKGQVRARWMTGHEYAKLQGAENFAIDGFRESQIQYAFGDAVAVPAVVWLVDNAVLPSLKLLSSNRSEARYAV